MLELMGNIVKVAEEGAAKKSNGWVLWVVLGVLVVGMLVMSIIPKKKQQKKAQEMMSSIRVGTKIKTIGGFVAVIKEINNVDNTFLIDMSATGDGSVTAVIDRSAIYTVLTPITAVAADGTKTTQVVEEEKAKEVVAADDIEADRIAKEKKEKKNAKKKEKTTEKQEDIFSASEPNEIVDAEIIDAAVIADVDVDEQIKRK